MYFQNINGNLRECEITSQQTFDDMKNAVYINGNRVYSTVVQDEWQIENNIVYNKTKDTAIIYAQPNDELRIIPKTVKKIRGSAFLMSYNKFWSNTIFDKDNDFAFIDDKVIYEKEVLHLKGDTFDEVASDIQDEQAIYVPLGVKNVNVKYDREKKNVIILTMEKIEKLNIGKDFGKNVEKMEIYGLQKESEIIIDPDNTFLIYKNNQIIRKDNGKIVYERQSVN